MSSLKQSSHVPPIPLPYYEDLYGRRSKSELWIQSSDVCEAETHSEAEEDLHDRHWSQSKQLKTNERSVAASTNDERLHPEREDHGVIGPSSAIYRELEKRFGMFANSAIEMNGLFEELHAAATESSAYNSMFDELMQVPGPADEEDGEGQPEDHSLELDATDEQTLDDRKLDASKPKALTKSFVKYVPRIVAGKKSTSLLNPRSTPVHGTSDKEHAMASGNGNKIQSQRNSSKSRKQHKPARTTRPVTRTLIAQEIQRAEAEKLANRRQTRAASTAQPRQDSAGAARTPQSANARSKRKGGRRKMKAKPKAKTAVKVSEGDRRHRGSCPRSKSLVILGDKSVKVDEYVRYGQ